MSRSITKFSKRLSKLFKPRVKIDVRQFASNQAVVFTIKGDISIEEKSENGSKEVYRSKSFWSREKKTIKWASAAALAVLVIGFSIYRLSIPWEERVYDRHYEPLRKASMILWDDSDFTKAKDWYEEGRSEDAWRIMKNLKEDYSRKKTLYLYKALVTMDMESYNTAIDYFNLTMEISKSGDFSAKIFLYRGLCYLRISNFSEAENDFRRIGKTDPREYKKAQKLLKRIKKYYR